MFLNQSFQKICFINEVCNFFHANLFKKDTTWQFLTLFFKEFKSFEIWFNGEM